MERLSNALLSTSQLTTAQPSYNRQTLKTGIVHLGVGAFHRAHQAWYTDKLLNYSGGDWGIVGVSLRSANVQTQLKPQDGLYTVVERSDGSQTLRIVGALQQVLVAAENPTAVVDVLAQSNTRVITLTITEKGYCFNPVDNSLLLTHADIKHDIENFPLQPKTAIGYLAASLQKRYLNQGGGVSLLSCDNLPNNGKLLKQVLHDYIAQAAPALWAWVESHVSFPSSMVDRIVPATLASDIDSLAATIGYLDQAAVFTEAYSQWVIEDDFINGKPDWAAVGALLVTDVKPFEEAKLRLLNGSHSLIAYLGFVAGYEYVHQVVANPDFNRLIQQYMNETSVTLNLPNTFDMSDYKQMLLLRFSNQSLNHKVFQIAEDGSQKITQRWLEGAAILSGNTLDDTLQPNRLHTFAVAGWLNYLKCRRSDGSVYQVVDPLSEKFSAVISETDATQTENNTSSLSYRIFMQAKFSPTFYQQYPYFFKSVEQYVTLIRKEGVLHAVKAVCLSS